MNKKTLGLIVVVIALIASFFGVDLGLNNQKNQDIAHSNEPAQNQSNQNESRNPHVEASNTVSPQNAQDGLKTIRSAYDQQKSDVQVQASGRVKAILRDDNEGSRHQKFILSLDNGLTVLVAHNIDLAPKIENLHKGDQVEFYGEYEFSQQGGVIHWTHRDPQNRHISGWLKHQGKTYE